MSEDQSNPGGDLDQSSGSDQENKDEQSNTEKDTVSYDSYKKALDEKKKVQARLKELEDLEKSRSEAEAKKREDYKALLEAKEQEVSELKTKYETVESRLSNGVKLNAFLSSLSGKVDQKYWNQIDLDAITMDSETGTPDEISLKKAVKDFETMFPEIIKKDSGPRMPNEASKGGGGKPLSYNEWISLPYDEKRKRRADVKD